MNTVIYETRPLSSLNASQAGEIIQISGKPEVHRFLFSKGLMMGSQISVDSSTPDTTLTVRSGNMVSTIGKDIARNIKVRLAR